MPSSPASSRPGIAAAIGSSRALADARRAAATPTAPASDGISSIAVLPFLDMSPGRDQDYLCEGLAEELINALTHIDGLRVAARTASFQFRSAGADIREVGRQLGVGDVCSKAACARPTTACA